MKEREMKTIWNRNYILLLLCNTISNVAFHMVTPILPKYAVSVGISLTMAGVLSGAFSITALVVRPFTGLMSDRFNKRNLVFLGTAILGVGTLGLYLAKGFFGILLFRIIQGIGFAINGTSIIAFATAFMPEENIGQGVGYFALSSMLGASFGPTVGLWIADSAGGYAGAFVVAAVFPFVASLLSMTVSSVEATPRKRSGKIRLSDLFAPKLLPYMLFIASFSLTNGITSSFISLSAEQKGITAFSAFFIIRSLLMLVSRPVAGKYYDRFGPSYIMLTAFAFTAATSFLIANAPNRWILFVAAVCAAFGMGIGSPTCQAECIKKMPKEQSGLAVSSYYIGADVAQGTAPMIGGWIADHHGYTTMYNANGFFVLAVAMFYCVYYYIEKKDMKSRRSTDV